jgi:hypothetical protein
VSTIKSRPVYPGLRAVPTARHNLVAVEGDGVQAVARMLVEAPEGFPARTHVLCTPGGGRADPEQLRALGVAALDVLPDVEQVLTALDGLLDRASMGTRLYAAGGEGFVGRVVRLGIDHGIDHKSVLTEHSGSLRGGCSACTASTSPSTSRSRSSSAPDAARCCSSATTTPGGSPPSRACA